MEIKKSPKANLEDKRLTFVFMGLIVALAILYTAFEWTQREITVHEVENEDFLIEEEIQIDQTFQEETPPPPPEPEEVPEVIEEIKIVEDDVETKDVDFSSEDKKDEKDDCFPDGDDHVHLFGWMWYTQVFHRGVQRKIR